MPADAATLRSALADRLDDVAVLTRTLVEVDSPTADAAGVRRVQQELADALAAQGFTCAWLPVGDAGLDVLDAELRFGDGPTVLVLGHADTVWPAGTAATWPFERAGGVWSGPGVGDMKSCLALAVHALAALVATAAPTRGAVRMLVIPDEEDGSVASRPAIEAAAREAVACLTLEAARPDGGLVTSRGAVGAMAIEARGRAAHVTDPGPHRDALAPLVRVVAGIAELDVPGASAAVGVVRGGTARQIVAERAEALVDLRADTTDAAERLADAVRALVAAEQGGDAEIEAHGGVTRPAFPRSDGTAALYAAASDAATELGQPVHEVAERGGSDASFAAALGVPTLDGLGPICHGSCSRDERIEEASLPVFGALLALLVASALDG